MERSVLIATPFFAPQNHAAVFRAYKLAKYLPQFGWKPIVLTVDTQYQYNEDPDLLNNLPKEVEVVKARYVEPTLRGVRMALGGRDRTFRALKAANGDAGERKVKPTSGAYARLLADWIQIPDAYWTWGKKAIATGREIVRARGIGVVLTTAPPYSCLVVGRALQEAGIKWVADFRDPLAYTKRLSSRVARVYGRQLRIVEMTLEKADAITVASSSFASIYHDMFESRGAKPVFIPTGIDSSLTEAESSSSRLHEKSYLLFAGEYLPDYDDSFLEAFARALENSEVRRAEVRLVVVGTVELNRNRLKPLVERLSLQNHVEFIDQVPQREVYKLLRGARAGVLVPGTRAYWWTTFAKMTDFIGMRKPVIAVVPDPSEARTALSRSRLGIFLDGPPEQRSATLTDFLLGRHQLPAPDENECERYTARRQVQSFVEIFESLTNARKMSATAS